MDACASPLQDHIGRYGPGPHLPSCALDTPAAIRTQSLEYVFPLQPQTGRKILLHIRGIAAHVPSISKRPQVPVGKLQKAPGSH
jgi:hypothetical protein